MMSTNCLNGCLSVAWRSPVSVQRWCRQTPRSPQTIFSLKITDRSFRYMHHLVFGINFQIHSVSPCILVSIHHLINFSTHLCHHPALIIHHSFSLSLQAQNLPFQQILPTLDFFYILDCLDDNGTGPDLTLIIFLFHILIFCLFCVVD